MTNNPGVGEVLKEMPDDQVTDSLRKLCYLQVQSLNQVSFPYKYTLYGNTYVKINAISHITNCT